MKKNRLFDKGLYFEGLRQSRVVGILSIVLTIVAEFLVFSANVITIIESKNNEIEFGNQVANILLDNPLMAFIAVVDGFLLPLFLFSFLNKRNQSDFYHSIPHKRTTIMTSFLSAALTWQIINIFASTAIAVFLYAVVLGSYYTISILSFFIAAISIFIMSLLVTSATLVAMSITGTTLMNFLVSLLILFVPRYIITIITLIFESIPFVDSSCLVFPFGNYNIFFNVFTLGGEDLVLYYDFGIIYTFCLAVLYLALAFVLFNKRNSEAAGLSAPSPFMQGVFRVLVTFVISIIPTWALTEELLSFENSIDAETILGFVTLYIIAIIAFFVFELITTKTAKNIIRIIPSLGIVLLLNVAFAGIQVALYNGTCSSIPEASEIKGINIIESHQMSDYFDSDVGVNYLEKKTENIEFSGSEITELIASTLSSNIKEFKSSGFIDSEKHNTARYINIHLKNRTIHRILYFTNEDSDKLDAFIMKNKEYKNVYFDFPDSNRADTYVSINNFYMSNEEAKELYKTVQKEIKTMDDSSWISTVRNMNDSYYYNYNDQECYLGILEVSSFVGLSQSIVRIPILYSMKESCDKYVEIINGHNVDNWEKKLVSVEDAINGKGTVYFNVYKRGINQGETLISFDLSMMPKKHIDSYTPVQTDFLNWLNKYSTKSIDFSKPYYNVTIDTNHYNNTFKDMSIQLMIQPPENDMQPLINFGEIVSIIEQEPEYPEGFEILD